MSASVPRQRKPSMPTTFGGGIFEQVGKYARGAVLFAFEEAGGAQELANWAKQNRTDFYTKLFPKIIARESEVTHKRDLDDLMDAIDADYTVVEGEPDPDAPLDFEKPMRTVESYATVENDPMDRPDAVVNHLGDDLDLDDLVEYDD